MSAKVVQPVSLCEFCRVGEGRAYWSLGNAHTALGNHQQAMYFAEKHLEIAKEVTVCLCFTSLFSVQSVTGIGPQRPLLATWRTATNNTFFVWNMSLYVLSQPGCGCITGFS